MDPKEKRKKAFEAVRALTVAGSQRRPLVVVVEDLHYNVHRGHTSLASRPPVSPLVSGDNW